MTHDGNNSGAATLDWREELRELLAALREDVLTPAQGARLDQLLREHDAAVATYVRTIAMQADLLDDAVSWATADPMDDENGVGDGFSSAGQRSGFQDAIYGLSVAEEALRPHEDDEGEALIAPAYVPRVAEPPSRIPMGWRVMWGAIGAVAAVLVIGLGAWLWRASNDGDGSTPVVITGPKSVVLAASQPTAKPPATAPAVPPPPPPPPPVVAMVSASVGATWRGGPETPSLGDSLRAGRTVDLAEGYARLTFVNGVDAVFEAPVRVTLESAGRILLERGRMTAKVPMRGRGFAVKTGLLEVVDLGTEFGVNVAADGAVQVPVFAGEVQARPAAAALAATSTTQPVTLLTAGQSVRASGAGLTVAPVGRDADAYVRDIRKIRGVLPARGTGQGLALGAPDPHWLITAGSSNPGHDPRPAIVCGPGPIGVPNDDGSTWISTAGDRPAVAVGFYTFATTFDLAGFDPRTAELNISLGVDNFVREVRLNGKPTGITLAVREADAKSKLTTSEIKTGFVPGENRLEVVVENLGGVGAKGRPNPMALRVAVSGTAIRLLDKR